MISKLINWWKNWHKKDYPLPYQFAIIKVNDVAMLKGVNDEENKIIEVYEGGKIKKVFPYSYSVVVTLEREEIPVIDKTISKNEEPFEFDEPVELGYIKEDLEYG